MPDSSSKGSRQVVDDVDKPLHGITVLDFSQFLAGPVAAMRLADLGARVIKVERRGSGDFARGYDGAVRGLSSYFAWLNRSKESLTLDLRHPASAGILARLLPRADVFVQNLRPGLMESLGLDATSLEQRYPRLVVCDVTGYGSGGPYGGRKAYDLIVQCEVGLSSVTGSAAEPAKVGISIGDIAAGMYAFSGILAALYRRERTGIGGRVEVSLIDALAEWMAAPAYYAAYGGKEPARSGMLHATIAPYGPYATKDRQLVVLAVQTEDEWRRLTERVLRRPEIGTEPRFSSNALRVEHRDALEEIVSDAVERYDRDELLEALDAAQIARGTVNAVSNLWRHPQLDGRGRVVDIASPTGQIRALLPPIGLSDMEPRMDRIPALGEDNAPVLRDLGYDDAEIAGFAREGVI